jgi:hypothetical protein
MRGALGRAGTLFDVPAGRRRAEPTDLDVYIINRLAMLVCSTGRCDALSTGLGRLPGA